MTDGPSNVDQKVHREFTISALDKAKDRFYGKFMNTAYAMFEKPVTYFRVNWIEPGQAKRREVYYHRKFRRVPTIDQCLEDDQLCIYEATEQMKRDKRVDKQIIRHLKLRFDECRRAYGEGSQTRCYQTFEDWNNARENYMIKYGDLVAQHSALDVYYKQVHRLIRERRQAAKSE